MIAKIFGELFKELRLKKGYTLREYCRTFSKDPAYISKMERGKIAPPTKQEKLEDFAISLDLKENTEEWSDFFSVALVSAGRIPKEIMSNKEVLQRLPIFLRTLTGEKLSDEKLQALIEVIKSS